MQQTTHTSTHTHAWIRLAGRALPGAGLGAPQVNVSVRVRRFCGKFFYASEGKSHPMLVTVTGWVRLQYSHSRKRGSLSYGEPNVSGHSMRYWMGGVEACGCE
jgi:hypothetical protein